MEGEKYTPNPGEVMKKRAETRAEVKAGMIEKHIAKKEALAADLQRKQEFAAAQAASDAEKMRQAEQSILEAAFFGEEEKQQNLSEGSEQKGFKRAERTVTNVGGSSTDSYRVSAPGVDRRQGYQEGGSDVQDVVVEKPSVWSKFKNLFKTKGQIQRELLSKEPMDSYPVRPRNAAEEALSKQGMHGTVRSETRATTLGMENRTSSSPLGSRKEIATLGEKMRATQALEDKGKKKPQEEEPQETEQEEYKEAA